MRVVVGVLPLGLPAREVAPVGRHARALGPQVSGVGRRHAALKLPHSGGAEFVLRVLAVVPGLVVVRVRVGTRRGLEDRSS